MWNPFKKRTKSTIKSSFQAQTEYTERRSREHDLGTGRKRLYAESELPAEYDDCPLAGTRYVGGQGCNTVGELKAANAKFYKD